MNTPKNSYTCSMEDISPVLEQLLQDGREVRIRVTGNSMYPLLRDRRDSVLLVKAEPGRLRKYDIPLYRRENAQYILHRIIQVKNGVFNINGDNQYVKEFPILPEQVVAVTKGVYRGERYISCKNWYYWIYARLWVWFLPFRKQMLWFYRHTFGKLRALVRKR